MYHCIKTILNSRGPIKSSGRIKVLEFFPSVKNTPRGVVVPVSPRTGLVNEVFRNFTIMYKVSKRELSSKRLSSILNFEQYERMLNEFISILKRKDNDIIISTAPISQMYETYKNSLEKFFVAGVVDIVDDSLGNPLSEILFIPKEGENVALGFSTYVSIAKRMFPKLNVNVSTASVMYKTYLNRIDADPRDTVEVPFLINSRTNHQLTKLVDELTSRLTVDIIREILNGGKDYQLERYYEFMAKRFGLRDNISKMLLVYRTGIINDYIEQLQDIAQISDMRTAYYEDNSIRAEELSADAIFAESSMFGIN